MKHFGQGETPMSNLFCELVFNLNLVQIINEPTHIHRNILDLVFTTDDIITSLLVHSSTSLPIISDHFAITFSLNTSLLSPSISQLIVGKLRSPSYIHLSEWLTVALIYSHKDSKYISDEFGGM